MQPQLQLFVICRSIKKKTQTKTKKKKKSGDFSSFRSDQTHHTHYHRYMCIGGYSVLSKKKKLNKFTDTPTTLPERRTIEAKTVFFFFCLFNLLCEHQWKCQKVSQTHQNDSELNKKKKKEDDQIQIEDIITADRQHSYRFCLICDWTFIFVLLNHCGCVFVIVQKFETSRTKRQKKKPKNNAISWFPQITISIQQTEIHSKFVVWVTVLIKRKKKSENKKSDNLSGFKTHLKRDNF